MKLSKLEAGFWDEKLDYFRAADAQHSQGNAVEVHKPCRQLSSI